MSDKKAKKPMTASDYIKTQPQFQGQPTTMPNRYSALAEFPPLSYSKAAAQEQGQSSTQKTEPPTQKASYHLKPNKQHLQTTPFDKPITLKQLQHHISTVFYPDSLYPTDNPIKNRYFYEYILVDSKSAEFTHYPDKNNPDIISYSTCKILRIASIQDLGFLHLHTQKSFEKQGFYVPGYSYTDYINAFFRAFFHKPYDHSWFITFDHKCSKVLPGWFYEWWYWFGPTDQIYPTTIIKTSFPYYQKLIPKTSIPTLAKIAFHIDMGIPWICSWHFNLTQLLPDMPHSLIREFRVKWWDKYNLDRCSLTSIQKFFNINQEIHHTVKTISKSIPLLTPSQIAQYQTPQIKPTPHKPSSPTKSTGSTSSAKSTKDKAKIKKYIAAIAQHFGISDDEADDDVIPVPMQEDDIDEDPFGGPLAQDPNE